MKYYRMDSDQYRWDAWTRLREQIDRREFAFAKALYHDFYSLLAEKYDPKDHNAPLIISLQTLAKEWLCSQKKVERYLEILGAEFEFCLFRDKKDVTATTRLLPSERQIVYPNFLKKQEKASRLYNAKRVLQDAPCGTLDLISTEVDRENCSLNTSGNPQDADVGAGDSDSSGDPPPPPEQQDYGEPTTPPAEEEPKRRLVYELKHARLALLMLDFVKKNPVAEKVGEADPKVWANEIRLAEQVDGIRMQLLTDVVIWAFEHNWWKFRIQSPSGLRSNWRSLYEQYQKHRQVLLNH